MKNVRIYILVQSCTIFLSFMTKIVENYNCENDNSSCHLVLGTMMASTTKQEWLHQVAVKQLYSTKSTTKDVPCCSG